MDTGIAHFDVGIHVGVGYMNSRVYTDTSGSRGMSVHDAAGSVGLRGLFFAMDRLAILLDLTGFVIRPRGDNIVVPVQVSVGLVGFLGGPGVARGSLESKSDMK